MYKIKDSVDLKKLEKFGYLEGEYMLYCSYGAYGKIYNKQLDNILEGNIKDTIYIIEINKKTKNIKLYTTTVELPRSFCYDYEDIVKPYIRDLIEADLVEEVKDYE